MATAYEPTVEEKRAALGHVYYEIKQFMDTNYGSRSGTSTSGVSGRQNVLDNAVLESCLLHVRILLDFFETSRSKRFKDSVLAEDYGFDARDVGIEDPYRTRLNKDLAHITYSRIGLGPLRKAWPPEKILPPMLIRLQEFIEDLLDNYLSANSPHAIPLWRDLLNIIKERLA